MKILVVSLLRLGDVIMAAPALAALRRRYPGAQIDLLVNKSARSVVPMLGEIHEVIEFDRDLLQQGLAEADRPIFEPFDRLKKQVAQLNSRHYDLVVNLTQNRLSGYVVSMVQAREKLGLALNAAGQASYGSAWFKFLNDIVASGGETVFHYSDIFFHGVGGDENQMNLALVETAKGRAEVEEFLRQVGYKSGPKVIVQALTSEARKNWGAANWVQGLAQFRVFESNTQIFLLGAPNEKDQLEEIRASLAVKGVTTDVAILSLEGALSLLNVSDLLITGDTSIKHLAVGSSLPILELALGGSEPRKTGAFKPNSLILRAQEAGKCAPEAVALAATKLLRKDWSALRLVAEEFSEEIEFYRTERLAFGAWSAANLLHTRSEKSLARQLDLAAWKFFLNKEHLKPLAEYGSGGLRLRDQVDGEWNASEQGQLRASLDLIENQTISAESRLNRLLAELSRRVRSTGGLAGVDFLDDEMKGEISDIEKQLGLGCYLSEKLALSPSMGLFRARQLQNSLNETFSQQQIKLKLIRSLRHQITESR